MGFFDKLANVGSSVLNHAHENAERERAKFEKKVKYESNIARGKSDDELKKQLYDKNENLATRYAAKTELERRS